MGCQSYLAAKKLSCLLLWQMMTRQLIQLTDSCLHSLLFFQIKTEYVKRKGIIIVDRHESTAVSALGDGSTLDVEGKLYLGGLPLDYVPKNLGNVRRFRVMGCL